MTTTTDQPNIDTANQLNASDRCDSCGAQAYVRVTMPAGGEFLFCAHHAAKHRDKLTALGADWHDETAKLYATSDTSL